MYIINGRVSLLSSLKGHFKMTVVKILTNEKKKIIILRIFFIYFNCLKLVKPDNYLTVYYKRQSNPPTPSRMKPEKSAAVLYT